MQHHVASHTRGRGRQALAAVVTAAVFASVSTSSTIGVPAAAASTRATARQSDTIVYTVPGDDVFAEGVAVDGDTYYVTGAVNNTIYRGDLDEPAAVEFINAGQGVGGIKVVGESLIVAGGFDGNVLLFNRTSGELVARWSNAAGSSTNINDLVIAPNGDAYITDSNRPVLYRIPAAELQNPSAMEQDLPIFLEWQDPPFSNYAAGILDANGIVATPDGKYVLVVHYSDGLLFRVRLSDKQVKQVDLRGYSLFSGDGMVITNDNVLYVVRSGRSLVAKLTLDAQYRRGRLLSETTDPTFHGPTTAAIAGDRLLVVNSQFSGEVFNTPRGRCRASRFPEYLGH